MSLRALCVDLIAHFESRSVKTGLNDHASDIPTGNNGEVCVHQLREVAFADLVVPGLMPAALTSTTTVSGPMWGSSMSLRVKTSPEPNCEYVIAFIPEATHRSATPFPAAWPYAQGCAWTAWSIWSRIPNNLSR